MVVLLTLEPLGVDFEFPSGPSNPQKPWFRRGGSSIFEKSRFRISRCSLKSLGFSGAPIWCSWGLLGGYVGALRSFRWLLESLKWFMWVPLSHHLGTREALNNPKQPPKRPDGEAEGPTKPPMPVWTRISTCCPTLPLSKTLIPLRRELDFSKIKKLRIP